MTSTAPVRTIHVAAVGAGCPIELGFEVFGSEGHVRHAFNRPNEWVLYQRGLGEEGTDAPRTIRTHETRTPS